jgi:carboxyl-terminal processing protease
MKKKIEIGTVIFIVIVAVVLACLATYMYLTSMMPSLVTKENFYDRITEVNKTIEQRYVGEADTDAAMDSLLTGYVSAVDKYSTYLNEEEYASYTSQMNGKYSGAGITVKYISATGLLKIINVKSNSPAAQADIEIGDIIVKIGDRNVEEMSYEEAINLLRSENGTVISLSLLRGEQELTKSVTIGEYVTSSVEYEMIEGDVGYVAISEFDNTTFDDFKKAVESLENDGAAQFIFDVRNNTGGSLTSVVNILDFLLPEGTLVTLKDNAGKETVHSSDANSFSKKYAVLINGSTYSGGELFAAAVRDFKAGTLVGETTYGKGYAQEIIPLSRGALYLSTKMYYPPNGENYDGVGVSPDVEAKLSAQLEDRFYELDYKEDTQIIAALNALGKQVA